MADWRTISDTEVDPDAPVTSELAYAFRDNPIAIAEGSVGAPKVVGFSLDIFSASNNYTNTPSSINGLSRVRLLEGHIGIQNNSAVNRSIQLSFSSDGVNWGAWQPIFGAAPSSSTFRYVRLNIVNGDWVSVGPNRTSGSFTVPDGVISVRFRVDGPDSSGYYDLNITGGRP